MSDITVTVIGGDGSSSITAGVGDTINVTTSPLAGPLPELQIAAGSGITVDSKNGVSTISANLPELSVPANLADLNDVSAGATSGQVLSYNGTAWGGLTLSIPANLADLSNVNGTPTTGQVLAWDGSSWAPADDQTGGSSNVANLADLADVSSTAPSTGQALIWSGSEWAGGAIPAGTTINGLSGAVNLVSGQNVSVTLDGQNLTIASVGGGSGVGAVNGLTGSITLAAGDGVSIASSGSTITLNATVSSDHTHVKANITDLTTGDLDMQGNRVLFANYYATQGDFPDPTVYHGMVAHSHADGAFYGAHAGAWVRLANQSEIPAATSVNTLTGGITLVGGDNINVTTSGQNITITGQQAGIVWQTPPQSGSSPGSPGDIAYDDNFLYLRTSQAWRQVALSPIATSITISQQPSNQSVNDGQDATFTVLATAGAETIAYQWEQSSDNGSTFADISGATSNSLTVTTNLSLDGYQYRASLSAPGATDATSSAATLTVAETFDLLAENGDRLMTEGGDSLDHDGVGGGGVATLTITQQPQNATASGGEASFAVAATVSDGSTLTYQWQEERLANDGATWVQQTLPVSNDWYGVTYGNGTFVAVGGDNSNVALTSPDGTTWTQQTLPLSANWWSVTYGNGTFVAVSRSAPAATSPDGITWTQQSMPLSADWVSVTYGNGIFVAVAAGSSIAATSPDGVTWTQQTLPLSANWWSVTYGNGTFVAVSITGDIAASSADGITWTQRTLPASTGWERVAYGNGMFVAVPSYSNIAATSPDGVTWTARTLPITENWRGVAYGNGVFVAVSILGAATSPDGITWTQQTILSNQIAWRTVTYGDGVFLTVAQAGTVAVTSTSTTAQFLPISGETAATLNLTGLTSADDGERYRVVVDSPSVEPVTSDTATLTVVSGWVQVNSIIPGAAAGDLFGEHVTLSQDGTEVLAITDRSSGSQNAAVYSNAGSGWSSLSVLPGIGPGDAAISAGGDVVALADATTQSSDAILRFKAFELTGGQWSQKGTTVEFYQSTEALIDIGDNGNLAVVLKGNSQGAERTAARRYQEQFDGFDWRDGLWSDYDALNVRPAVASGAAVFAYCTLEYENQGSETVVYNVIRCQTLSPSVAQLGGYIRRSALALAMNSNGTLLAVALKASGGATTSNAVAVYEYDGTDWSQRGADVAISGVTSVSLSDNGLLAIGKPAASEGGTENGLAQVYEWNGTAWDQYGGNITGDSNFDQLGISVHISGDGTRLAVGATGEDAGGSNSGGVKVYQYY